jgi:hypothetical protein
MPNRHSIFNKLCCNKDYRGNFKFPNVLIRLICDYAHCSLTLYSFNENSEIAVFEDDQLRLVKPKNRKRSKISLFHRFSKYTRYKSDYLSKIRQK